MFCVVFIKAVNSTVTQGLGLSLCVRSFISRRVHISSVTLEHLKGSYKVEPGDGQSRDSYLKEHNVVTYLVINPKVRRMDPLAHWKLTYQCHKS